jgi:hypothetical protein
MSGLNSVTESSLEVLLKNGPRRVETPAQPGRYPASLLRDTLPLVRRSGKSSGLSKKNTPLLAATTIAQRILRTYCFESLAPDPVRRLLPPA